MPVLLGARARPATWSTAAPRTDPFSRRVLRALQKHGRCRHGAACKHIHDVRQPLDNKLLADKDMEKDRESTTDDNPPTSGDEPDDGDEGPAEDPEEDSDPEESEEEDEEESDDSSEDELKEEYLRIVAKRRRRGHENPDAVCQLCLKRFDGRNADDDLYRHARRCRKRA